MQVPCRYSCGATVPLESRYFRHEKGCMQAPGFSCSRCNNFERGTPESDLARNDPLSLSHLASPVPLRLSQL